MRGGRVNATSVAVLIGVVLLVVFPLVLLRRKELQYTAFYDEEAGKKRVMDAVEVVQQESRRFFAEDRWPLPLAPPQQPWLCVAVVTAPREEASYVEQCFFSLLRDVSLQDQGLITVLVSRAPHSLAAERLRKLVHIFSPQEDEEEGRGGGWFDRESRDYVAALKACAATQAPLTLVLEDDVSAARHSLSRLRKVAAQLRPFQMAKLYYSEHFQGWGRDNVPLLLLLSVSAALAFSLVFFIVVFFSFSDSLDRYRGVVVFFFILSIFFPIAAISLGKQNVWPVYQSEGIHPWAAPLTQAILFNGGKDLHALIAHFDRLLPSNRPIDLLLSDIVERHNMSAFVVSPSLFQHVGIVSSRPFQPNRHHHFSETFQEAGMKP